MITIKHIGSQAILALAETKIVSMCLRDTDNEVQGKILHTRTRKSEIPLENTSEHPLDNSSRNPLGRGQRGATDGVGNPDPNPRHLVSWRL